MSRGVFIKIAVGAAAILGLGYLFVRSALNVQSAPYTVAASGLAPWTLAQASPSTPSGALLVLRPPEAMAGDLFKQIFSRMSESLTGPAQAEMPLLLRGEFDRALAGGVTPDALLAVARESGLDAAAPSPRCLVTRRISAPGTTRQVYAALFDLPAFSEFRQRVQQRWPSSGGDAFDPAALSPAVLVATTDGDFESWYPIRVQQESDCLAPITVQ